MCAEGSRGATGAALAPASPGLAHGQPDPMANAGAVPWPRPRLGCSQRGADSGIY